MLDQHSRWPRSRRYPSSFNSDRDISRFDRKSGKWVSSTAKNRIRELVKAKYIRPANPRKARNPEQRENWKMFWWERPYLLGPRGIEALQGEMKRVEMFLPVKDGSVPKFPPSPTRISVHGSNDTKHEMGLVELRYLLEQATRKVGGGLGLDLRGESEPGPPRGWISERSLFYHPRWPMFRKGKHRSLNRPAGRHPDAILEWRGGGGPRMVRPSLGRIAVEYESSQRAQNPKSVSQYTQITESYLRLLCAKQGKDAYLHWVLYVFEEESAAKRFLRNILPQVPRKLARAWYRRSPDMLPELFMTAIWPEWRDQLVRSIRGGKRMPLPVQHRAWNRERHEMAAIREMDFWQVGDQDSFGWHPPEAAMSWWRDEGEASLRCFIANTRAAAELAGELLGKPGDALEAMREKESDGWTWTKDREPRVFFFPPETPVWVHSSQRGEEKAVLRVALLTRSLQDLERWSVALEGFTKRELVSFAEDWTVQHRNNVRDPDYMQPNGTLSDEAYLRFQRESTRMRPQEASFAPVPVFRDVASFRKMAAAARDDERLPGDAKLRSAMQVYKIEATPLRCRGRYHSLWRIADDRARPWVVEGKYLKRRDAKSWWVVGEFDGLDHDVEGDEEE